MLMYRIGIDLGGTNIAVGIVDENFKIVKKKSTPTIATRPITEIVYDMGRLCNELVSELGIGYDEIEYVGIAAPGSINPVTGVVEYSNNIPMAYFPMTKVLGEYIPVEKIYIDNDANAAALGEAIAGAAKGANHAIMITLGTGVGGGIIIDGKIYSGFNFAGAELGHIVIEVGGRQCTCGRKGCWETYSSATGLIQMTKEKLETTKDTLMWELIDGDINKVSGKTAFAAMKKGDLAATEVVNEYLYYLGSGITNIVNIFQPEIVCIGGGVCNEGDYLLLPIKKIVAEEQYARNTAKKTEIKIASLGNDAGIIGAAALGVQQK